MIKIMLSISALCTSASFAFADTITVCLDGTCDFNDPAVAAGVLVEGDTLEIAAGTYLLEESFILYGQNAHVRGAVDADGNPATILDGQGAITVLNTLVITDETVFENLVITNGRAEYGAGMFLFNSNPIFRNCIIRDNHAEFLGGGMFLNHDSSPTMIDCEITGNIAESTKSDDGMGAAVHISSGTLTLVDSLLTENVAEISGGGISFNSSGVVILERSRICGNTAASNSQVYGSGKITILGGCIEDDCDPCVTTDVADLNFDGIIDVTDLLLLLGMWGGTGSADIDSNGVVDVSDLLILIGSWS